MRGRLALQGHAWARIRWVNYEFVNMIVDVYFAIDTAKNGRFSIHIIL